MNLINHISFIHKAENLLLDEDTNNILITNSYAATYTLFAFYNKVAEKAGILDDDLSFEAALMHPDYQPTLNWPHSKHEMLIQLSQIFDELMMIKWERFIKTHPDLFQIMA